jgi:hypothetical protein
MHQKQRGQIDELCGNWIGHMSILESMHTHKISVQCPECGKTHEFLGWTCCNLSIEEASRMVHEKYTQRCLTKIPERS